MILLAGFMMVDLVAADLPELPAPGDLVYAPRGISAYPGGHPDNVASTLVRLGHDPRDLTLVGAVGNDAFGDFLTNAMRSLGINLMVHSVGASTGKTVSLKPRGKDRSFVVDVGANAQFDAKWALSALEELRPSFFYVAGGILGKADEEIPELLRKAKELGAVTLADSVRPLGKSWDYLRPALPYVDFLHLNREEARELTGEGDWEKSARALNEMGARIAAVTDEDGVMASWDGQCLFQPSFKVEALDTTAAGDSFVAGFLEMASKKRLPTERRQLEEFLRFAQATAAVKCMGVSTSSVSLKAVEQLLKGRARLNPPRTPSRA
ncbi:carbohydrate kinase family protein [Tardisphaera miroshnichenkoae]